MRTTCEGCSGECAGPECQRVLWEPLGRAPTESVTYLGSGDPKAG